MVYLTRQSSVACFRVSTVVSIETRNLDLSHAPSPLAQDRVRDDTPCTGPLTCSFAFGSGQALRPSSGRSVQLTQNLTLSKPVLSILEELLTMTKDNVHG